MILIVDDDLDFVESVKIVLEHEGHQVMSAGNPEEGMKIIHQENPDLLILDVMMIQPDDGIVMAQDLRKSGFTNPILMLSNIGKISGFSYTHNDEFLPVNDFLGKPIEPKTLLEKVKTLLHSKKENQG